ncbi:MAG TPA: hypothetical protein VIK53_06005 [Verrucomicrobiae bacterium]
MTKQPLRHREATTYETGAGKKTSETASQKIFANCPCHEAKAE